MPILRIRLSRLLQQRQAPNSGCAARKVDQSAAQKVSHLEGGSFYADLLRRQYI